MRNKIDSENNFSSVGFDFKKENTSVSKSSTPVISLNEYLAKHNRNRKLDNVIRKWFLINNRNNPNPRKTKEEWDKIMESFQNETAK
jgi:hypothetical protein